LDSDDGLLLGVSGLLLDDDGLHGDWAGVVGGRCSVISLVSHVIRLNKSSLRVQLNRFPLDGLMRDSYLGLAALSSSQLNPCDEKLLIKSFLSFSLKNYISCLLSFL